MMRILAATWLVLLAALVSAAPAGAYAVYFDISGAVIDPDASDAVAVEVLLDVAPGDPGIEAFSIGVLATSSVVVYAPGASANPSYILYSPADGKGEPSVYMVPPSTPMALWPTPPAGLTQVNVAYVEANLGSTRATGVGILLATLVFHVQDGSLPGTISLSVTAPGTFFRNGYGVDIVPPEITLGAPVTIVPEPASALLVGLGLVGLGLARARRSSR